MPSLIAPGLAGDAAAVGENQDIETIRHFDRQQRLPHRHAPRFGRKIIFQSAAIDRDFARSGPEKHTGDAAFAAPGSQILFNLS